MTTPTYVPTQCVDWDGERAQEAQGEPDGYWRCEECPPCRYVASLPVEDMHEGWLVKGTRDGDAAIEATARHLGVTVPVLKAALDPAFPPEPGTYRKMPSQWGSWRLHEAAGRGSFEATIVRCYRLVERFPREGVAGR